MDWNALKVFLAVADKGSLSGAANHLQVNHSTVYRRLQTLEEDMDGRLFERINNRYLLTPMGEELLLRAKNIEGAFDDLERHIIGTDVKPRGVVKITSPRDAIFQYLVNHLARFNEQYPDIHIELLLSNQMVNMNSRQADIALRATHQAPDHLVGKKICVIGWGVFGSPTYEQRFGQSLPNSFNELGKHSIIGAASNMKQVPMYSWLEKHFAAQIHCRCDDMLAMSYFAQTGQGLAILPNDQARPGIKRLFGLPQEKPDNLWLLTHPDLRNVERIKLVMRFLADAFMKDKQWQGLARET